MLAFDNSLNVVIRKRAGCAQPVSTRAPEGVVRFVADVAHLIYLPTKTADADEQGALVVLILNARRMHRNEFA